MSITAVMRALLIPVFVSSAAGFALAQDQTPAVPENCTKMESKVLPASVCLDPEGWALADVGSTAELEFSTLDQALYLIIMTEPDYFDIETLRKAVLTNIQLAAKLNKVEVVESENVSLAGREFGHLIYGARIGDIDANYNNYFTGIEGEGSLQVVFFTFDRPISDYNDTIATVVASIEVGE